MQINKRNIFSLLMIAVWLFNQTAIAEEEPQHSLPSSTIEDGSPFSSVHQFVLQEQWISARLALQEVEQNPDADPAEVLFLRGTIAQGMQNLGEAELAFTALLKQHPENLRARLELGKIYYQVGDFTSSKRYFQFVKDSDIPPEVSENVSEYLDKMESLRDWQAGISLGAVADTNINQSTGNQTVMLGGIPFSLSSDAKQTSGQGASLFAYGEKYWFIAPNLRWNASSNLLRREFGATRFDDTLLNIRTGPRIFSENSELGFGVSLAKRWLGNAPYNHASGLYLDSKKQLTAQTTASLALDWQYYGYDAYGYFPGAVITAAPKVTINSGESSQIEASIDLTQDQMISDSWHHKTIGAGLGYRTLSTGGWTWGANVHYGHSRFDNQDAIFLQPRRDHISSVSIEVSNSTWDWHGLHPMLSAMHLENRSSIDFYSYRRNIVQIGAVYIY